MYATGIVAEYNPFHNGHAYQINEIKRQLNPDVIVAVMSGNFLQRGEPAIVDKWTRAQMALHGGVDLVVELPVLYSTQPADYFAKGAIDILRLLNIDSLSFGVESGSASDFVEAARWMVQNEHLIDQKIKEIENHNVPYAKQMEDMVTLLNPDLSLYLNSPNNQLGFAYTKELTKHNLENKIKILPIVRKSAHYSDKKVNQNSNIASATALRRAMFKNEKINKFIPKESMLSFQKNYGQIVNWDNYFPYLKYQLTVQSEKSLRAIYEMNEGLENRLKKYITSSNSFSEFMKNIKTKRYTQTRLQRLLVYVLLQITKEDILNTFSINPPVRVLGFNQKGQQYLSRQKNHLGSSLLTNINQKTRSKVPFDILAGQIYQLGDTQIQIQDFKRKPIKLFDSGMKD